MKLRKKIWAAVAVTTALVLGAASFVSCSNGDDDDEKTPQIIITSSSEGIGNTPIEITADFKNVTDNDMWQWLYISIGTDNELISFSYNKNDSPMYSFLTYDVIRRIVSIKFYACVYNDYEGTETITVEARGIGGTALLSASKTFEINTYKYP